MAKIITLGDFKDYMGHKGSGRDDRATSIVDGINAFVLNHTGRDWESKERDELYPGMGGITLLLRHYPVTSVTSITEDGVTIDPDDSNRIELEGAKGMLIRTTGSWIRTRRRVIRVVYLGGEKPPDDLQLAALEMSKFVWQSSGGHAEILVRTKVLALTRGAMHELPTVKPILDRHGDSARGMFRVT